jgi:Mg2+/Co2+ transporter CorB
MSSISIEVLYIALFILIVWSAFFSASETGMMSVNRYRLKHLAETGNNSAKKARELLARPDRLIGVILIGSNLVNTFAASVATTISIRLWGENGIAVASAVLSLIFLIFSEIVPKTLAAVKAEKTAMFSVWILHPLLYIIYPIVWAVSHISQFILRPLGVGQLSSADGNLSREELRTVVSESGSLIPRKHRKMLLSILDLEQMQVEDVMIPKSEVFGVNIEEDFKQIIQQLNGCHHTRIVIFRESLNHPIGILHARQLAKFLSSGLEKNKANLLQFSSEPYYILKDTPLHTQLAQFQKEKKRLAIVVDEYSEVRGIVTLEDILEEIVGDFTTNISESSEDIHAQPDGSYIINGATTLREINRRLKWALPTEGPKTLNGLIIEALESIPTLPTSLKINDYVIEVLQAKDNVIRTARARKLN